MKRFCSMALVLLAAVLLTGCQENAQTKQPSAETMTMETMSIFDNLDLADNCALELSGNVSWQSSAAVYEAGHELLNSADSIADVLMGEGCKDLGDGRFEDENFSLKVTESTISFFKKGEKTTGIKEYAIPYDAREYATAGYQQKGISKEDYGSDDLAFMPLSEADQAAKLRLADIGVNNIELRGAYSLDKDTIMQNIKKSIEHDMESAGEDLLEEERARLEGLTNLKYEEADECYMFVYRMNIDNIPVLTGTSTPTQREICGVEICCLYGKDGFIDISMRRLPSGLKAANENQELISPAEAAKILLPKFAGGDDEVTIFSVQMCYSYYNTDYTTLTPTWVFTASCERKPYEDKDIRLTYYLYYAVNALTGEVVERDTGM